MHHPSSTDPIDPAALAAAVRLGGFEHVPEIGSTMDRGRALADDPTTALPAVVVADRQTAGRGRRGAGWWQSPGSLATSIVVDARAHGADEPAAWWSLAAGIALAESLADLAPAGAPLVRWPVTPVVRWPNDIEVAGRKLAGILVESVGRGRAVFGIGVNTSGRSDNAPVALRQRLVTWPDLTGAVLPRQQLLVTFLPRLLGLLDELTGDPTRLVTRYRPLCGLAGKDVTVFRGHQRLTGRCLGIDSAGALVLDTVAGRLHLASASLTDPAAVWPGVDPA
jgi:BirA family biotin operon repressor/biotin-[acetyl-CoA-carboxylase] ligase